MRKPTRWLTSGLLAVAALFAPLAAQGDSEVTNRQEQARLRFEQLHESMQRLQSILAKTEPERGVLLSSANRYVQEAGIATDMAAIRDLLKREEWDLALERMTAVREELSRLLDMLLDRDLDMKRLLDEIKKLEQFRDRVDDLIEREQEHKEAAARAEALQKHLEALKAAQAELAAVLEEQRALREAADDAGQKAAAESAEAMTKSQAELEARTGELADDVKRLEQEAKELAKPDAKGDEKQAKADAAKDSKSNGKAESGEPTESEPKDGQPGEAAGKPGKACKNCQAAAKSMGQSKQELGQNLPENSLEDMDAAMRQLEAAKKALEEMEEEARRELQQLPFETLAREQERTKVDTDQLSQEMEKAAESEDGEESKPTPGQKNVQQAVPKMRSAAGSLKEYKPSKAKQDQQDAKEDLEAAKQALEDALAQLRQELQDEVLRALEERFAAMLEAQKELSARTEVADGLRAESLTADGSLPAAIRERCQELGRGELTLASEAGDALKLLQEEGTTAVFPEIVQELKDDLMTVAGRLQKFKTGRATRSMQADIEETLKTLINSLRRAIEDSEGGGCGT